MGIQSTYAIYPDLGYAGGVARPNEPMAIDLGLFVGSGVIKPGQAVRYDRANDGFVLPTNVATSRDFIGVVHYRRSEVQTADDEVEFSNGDDIEVGVMGTFWVISDNAVKYGDRMAFDTSTGNFHMISSATADVGTGAGDRNITDPLAASSAGATDVSTAINAGVQNILDGNIGGIGGNQAWCVSPKPVAAGGLAQMRLGYGKVW